MGILLVLGGYLLSFAAASIFSHPAVTVPSRCPCSHIRIITSAWHFISTSIIFHPPSSFRLCSVDSGTLNIAACHIYHTTADTICLIHSRGRCSTCAVYHSFESKYVCTNVIRCAMLRSLLYARLACVRTMTVTLVQLACANFFYCVLQFYSKNCYFPLYRVFPLHHMRCPNCLPLRHSIFRYSALRL